MLTTLIAFVVALGLLIAVHEWGHYRMAVACGVRVLRYSIGFGPVLLRFRPRPGQETEFVLAAIPFGGYVKMLDEREGPVDEHDKARAFNTQSLRARALIVAAGPLANLVLAALLFATVNWVGVQEPRAVLSTPVPGSLAERVGVQGGEWVRAGAFAGQDLQSVASFESLRWLLTRGALEGQDVVLELLDQAPASDAPADASQPGKRVLLPLSGLRGRDPDATLFRQIGLLSPLSRPLISSLVPGGAAERAGLQSGDVVLHMGDTPVRDGPQLRELIRLSGQHGTPPASRWRIERNGRELVVEVQPEAAQDDGQPIGRIGAMVGSAPEMALVRKGLWDGLASGVTRVWDISVLSLRLLGRMATGQMSLKNLSGPIAIADYAGQSASLGLTYYLGFLAFISVSLGVLNLLPVPVLDGGHLMYYLWEAVTGRPVAGAWLARLQYLGMSLLLTMMGIAMYNDIVHRLG